MLATALEAPSTPRRSATAAPGDVIAARSCRPARHRVGRVISGAAVIAAMLSSIAVMMFVIHDRVGFSPVLSPSMQPAFAPGDLIVTRSEPASAMRVGQVVALPIPGSHGQHYVHRLISVRLVGGKPVVRTKGDANPLPEPYQLHVTSKTVPVVIAAVPRAGRISLLVQRSWTRLLLIAITLIFGAVAGKRLIAGASRRDESGGVDHD